jgi:two-component system, OmpR family, sensor histidine kinase KdpD
VVYAPEKAQRAKENFFKEPTLAALREMALRQAAHEVEVNLRNGSSVKGSPEVSPAVAGSYSGRERILIYVTPSPSTAALIRRGRRVADYLGADCVVVVILPEGGMEQLPPLDKEALERHLSFAQKLRIETRIISSPRYESEASALVDFARRNRVTQVFVNKPGRAGFASWLFRRDFIANMLRQAGDIQVTVVADRRVR